MVNDTLDDYRALVYQVAHRMRAGKPACVELDDLVQAGMIGLIEASKRFEPDNGATFAGFATTRIQGAMLDELRGNDWMTRRERRFHKRIEQATCRLQQRHLRVPRDTEIADELGISVADYAHLAFADCDAPPTSLNELMSGDRLLPDDLEQTQWRALETSTADLSADPSAVLQQLQMQNALQIAIASLPERQRSAMNMYYSQDLNLKEIGAHLGVCESRVSQLISKAIVRLRDMLADWRQDNTQLEHAARA